MILKQNCLTLYSYKNYYEIIHSGLKFQYDKIEIKMEN